MPLQYDCGQDCNEAFMTVDHRIEWESDEREKDGTRGGAGHDEVCTT